MDYSKAKCIGNRCRCNGQLRMYPSGKGELILCHHCWTCHNAFSIWKYAKSGRDFPTQLWDNAKVYAEEIAVN